MEPGPDICPPAIIEVIQEADLQTDIGDTLFARISQDTTQDCQLYALSLIGGRLSPRTHLSVSAEFAETAGMFARALTRTQRDMVRDAYLQMPYHRSIAVSYFNGLRLNGIDIRAHVADKVTGDWSFRHPRDENAETWHYFLYLASLEEHGALQKLENKMDETDNPNDLTNLLRSFAALKGEAATEIIKSYADDPRRAEGVSGPGTGQALSDTVEQILAYR